MKKKLYYELICEHLEIVGLIMTPTSLIVWLNRDNEFEKVSPYSYKITPFWLTKKEVDALQEADI